MSAHDRIFDAVFPPPSELDIPTPSATPLLGSSLFGQPFGSAPVPRPSIETSASRQIEWDRAWHTATAYLSLKDEAIETSESEDVLRKKWVKPLNGEVRRALEYVLLDEESEAEVEGGVKDDLLRWYFEEVVVTHYVKHVRPELVEILEQGERPVALLDVAEILQVVLQIYSHPLRSSLERILPEKDHGRLRAQIGSVRALFRNSLPPNALKANLHDLFAEKVLLILEQPEDDADESSMQRPAAELRQEALQEVENVQSVGLGGLLAERVFAEVMCEALCTHVNSVCPGRWLSPSKTVDELQDWVENDFSRFIVEVLYVLQDGSISSDDQTSIVPHTDVERWKEMGIKQLGILRTDELFEVVVEWDETRGAIEDLQSYIGSPEARTHLSKTFSDAIGHRLLQPGASTIEILQVYVAIIRAFTVLDPKGVLLDRVARPIRRYLREREDTVQIVVGGLLADPDAGEDEDSGNSNTALVELAREMSEASGLKGGDDGDDDDIDFDDMEWLPDPVDAGPDYKKSKSTSDVIGSLISLFESKIVFVQEFQKILGERLLKQEYDFDREIRVLELLKVRFGETALQACEVMLRDVLDSRRVDAAIHRGEAAEFRYSSPRHYGGATQLHARILSHLFWPPMPDETFQIPAQIRMLQAKYSEAFEDLKASRKLTWLNSIGQVTVVLELEDRTVTEVVTTWQAAVINYFQPTSVAEKDPPKRPIRRSTAEIVSYLSMSQTLVVNALAFWIGKLVLRRWSDDTYTVIETLPLGDDASETPIRSTRGRKLAAAPVNSPNAATSALLAAQSSPLAASNLAATSTSLPALSSNHSKMTPYAPYITGMLTNAGPMPVASISMMLKIAVPGGFPYPDSELKEWLEEEVRGGRLGYGGGSFKLAGR